MLLGKKKNWKELVFKQLWFFPSKLLHISSLFLAFVEKLRIYITLLTLPVPTLIMTSIMTYINWFDLLISVPNPWSTNPTPMIPFTNTIETNYIPAILSVSNRALALSISFLSQPPPLETGCLIVSISLYGFIIYIYIYIIIYIICIILYIYIIYIIYIYIYILCIYLYIIYII